MLRRTHVVAIAGTLGLLACARLADLDTTGGAGFGVPHAATDAASGPGAATPDIAPTLAGDVEISPPSLTIDFGAVACGGKTSGSPITILNTSNAPVAWSATPPTDSPFFVDGPLSGTLDPGSTVKVSVGVQPKISGDLLGAVTISAGKTSVQVVTRATGQGGDLSFVSSVADFGKVPINGTATVPIQIKNGGTAPASVTALTISDPHFNVTWEGGSALLVPAGGIANANALFTAGSAQSTYVATLTPTGTSTLCSPAASLSATAVTVNTQVGVTVADFGAQSCNTTPSGTQTITISNYLLNDPLPLGDFALQKGNGSAFTLGTSPTSAPKATDASHPGTATITVVAKAIGATVGAVADTLSFTANGVPQSTPVRMDVQGANLVITPSRIDFSASTSSWTGDAKSFTIKNMGNAKIRVSYDFLRTKGAAAWYKDDSTDDLAPDATAQITMTFKPSYTGDHEATETPHFISGAQNCLPMPVATAHGVGTN